MISLRHMPPIWAYFIFRYVTSLPASMFDDNFDFHLYVFILYDNRDIDYIYTLHDGNYYRFISNDERGDKGLLRHICLASLGRHRAICHVLVLFLSSRFCARPPLYWKHRSLLTAFSPHHATGTLPAAFRRRFQPRRLRRRYSCDLRCQRRRARRPAATYA